MSINARRVERPARAHYEAGELIGGKYRLARKIGEGSMGAVWVATNVALDSKVAIKLLSPELRSAKSLTRFLREARSAAMLDHPAIVRVFDLGAGDGGEPFIVMELLTGESLGSQLARVGALSAEQAVQLILPIAAAIEMAHQHGVVHRDIKPDNIMLAEVFGGRIQPKVVDFGVAKLKWGEPNGSNKSTTGMSVIGTPDYMAPEQASGMAIVDHHADIWSLCVVLYEAISGRAPFGRDQVWSTLHAVVEEPAPSLVETNGVDAALWAILDRGLQKAPADRWQSTRELGEALAAWLESRGVYDDACGTSLRANWLRTTSRPATSVPPPVHEPDSTPGAATRTLPRDARAVAGPHRGWIAAPAALAALAMMAGAWRLVPLSDFASRQGALASPPALQRAAFHGDEGVAFAAPPAQPEAPPATPIEVTHPADTATPRVSDVGIDAGAPLPAAAPTKGRWTARGWIPAASYAASHRPTAGGTAPGYDREATKDTKTSATDGDSKLAAPKRPMVNGDPGWDNAGDAGAPALPDPL